MRLGSPQGSGRLARVALLLYKPQGEPSMNSQERRVYKIECELLRKYFKDVRTRPVRIVKNSDFDGRADEPHMLINKRLLSKKAAKELEDTLKHELIHYELKDNGKDYDGHGKAFLKRASELGILGRIELDQCFSLEEYQHSPTKRKLVKISMKKVKEQIEREIEDLLDFIVKLPEKQRVESYRLINNLRVTWQVYSGAVERGEDHVMEERWVKRRGPRGKSLEGLRKEYNELKPEYSRLLKEFISNPSDQALHRKLQAVQNKRSYISHKVEKDYGFSKS